MADLNFSMEQVAGLVQHAKAASEHFITFEERAELYGEDKCLHQQPGEEKRARAKLVLVKDRGIYLMSSGRDNIPEGGKIPVAYAEGFDPERVGDDGELHDRCRAAVGGDDFCEEVPLSWLDVAQEHKSPDFRIRVTRDQFALQVPPKPTN